MKILVTGASGFIGTNVLEYFVGAGFNVANFDIEPPRNISHKSYWVKVDICDQEQLKIELDKFKPDYVVHLAGKTNLNEKDGIDYYLANTVGVKNLVNLCHLDSGVKRVVFASSMLVNEVGYTPKNIFDYNPATLYGQSKVIGERIVLENKESLTEHCIVRPTSIWGEWFSEPYRNFFDYVLDGKYFHPGYQSCTKTYGYVGNVVYQIKSLLFADAEKIHGKVFYLGDKPPIKIDDWADEIALLAEQRAPIRLPFPIFKFTAFVGDLFGYFRFKFPMTSFRLTNMITNHVVNLDDIYNVCGSMPYDRKTGIKRTLIWMNNVN